MTKRILNLLQILGLALGLVLAYGVYSEYNEAKKMYRPILNFDSPLDIKANQVGFYVPITQHHGNYWEFALVTPRGIERVNTDKNVLNSIETYKNNGTYGTEVFASEEEALLQLRYMVDDHYLNMRLGK